MEGEEGLTRVGPWKVWMKDVQGPGKHMIEKDTVEKLTLFNVCDVRERCVGVETHMRYVCKWAL